MVTCVRCVVRGRVQGVWYRESTRRTAVRLGVAGSAVNLPDGTVEVIACGEEAAVERLHAWLWEGPPAARVEEVSCRPLEGMPPLSGFTTG